MKVLSAAQTKKADSYTIEHEPIKSIDLMQRAAESFVSVFIKYYDKTRSIKVFCGTGNNGGDGLAVARILFNKGYKVKTFIINFHDEGSPDFLTNYKKHFKILKPELINDLPQEIEFEKNDILIDAIFGSGLTRKISGLYAEVIHAMNESGCQIISIDIASGLFADIPSDPGAIIKPTKTISFQMPKLAFFIPENSVYTGEWEYVDIGLDKGFLDAFESTNQWITEDVFTGKIKKRDIFAHKGQFGKSLIISGSYGKMGATLLAAKACLRSGAGLLTIHAPECGYSILQTYLPEAMVSIDSNSKWINDIPDSKLFNALGIGPGIGISEGTGKMFKGLLDSTDYPIVIDADAINLLGKNKDLLSKIPEGSILTPHLVEFERISRPCTNHFERLLIQKEMSVNYNIIIVLKGAYTSISLPNGQTYFNSTGNPGMATGGSGDVLTGIITGLLAQGYESDFAALLGVYLHGLAGDLGTKSIGEDSLIASDIISFLPNAFLHLKKI